MSWFSKKLKKITNTVDPIGHQIRKSTGGSYGDPLNFHKDPAAGPAPYQRPEQKLFAAPSGGSTLPTMKLGGSSGGYGYVPNRFANAGPIKSPGQPNVPTPSVPPNTGAMSFGGGQPMNPSGPGMMGGAMMGAGGASSPMASQMGSSMGAAAQNYMRQNPQMPTPQQQSPMQAQMAQINALRRIH